MAVRSPTDRHFDIDGPCSIMAILVRVMTTTVMRAMMIRRNIVTNYHALPFDVVHKRFTVGELPIRAVTDAYRTRWMGMNYFDDAGMLARLGAKVWRFKLWLDCPHRRRVRRPFVPRLERA